MSRTIKDLRAKVANIVTEARALNDEITDDTKPERVEEITAQVDRGLEEARGYEAQIERLEKLEKLERSALEAQERAEEEARSQRRPGSSGSTPAVDAEDVPSYRDAFVELFRAGGDRSELSPELRAVLDNGRHSNLKAPVQSAERRAQTTAAAAGGYTIPEEFMPELVRSMLMFGPMYDPGVTRELVTAGGNPMPFPTINDTAQTAAASTEGATLTDDGGKDATFGEKQLDAFSFDTEWLHISVELAQDSAFNMGAIIGSLLGERLGRTANAQLTVGSGSSAPHGIVTASGSGVVAASTSAITADELIDFEHSVDAAYRRAPSVRFMFHDTTLAALKKLKDGDGNYLWQMGDIRSGAPGTLLGHTYVINNDMAELGDGVNSRVMVFGDFQKYWVRKIAGMPLIGLSNDKDFWPGFGMAGYTRFDGELSDTAAVKHLALAAS